MCQSHQPSLHASNFEISVASIQENTKTLVLQGGHYNVKAAVPSDIAEVRAHTGNTAPITVIGHPGIDSNFFEALPRISEHQGACVVICYEESGPAISGKVRHRNPHSFSKRFGQRFLSRNVGKGSIAVVMEKLHCLRMIFVWMAIASQIRSHSAADRIKPRRPVAVIGNKKVKLAVAIVVRSALPAKDICLDGNSVSDPESFRRRPDQAPPPSRSNWKQKGQACRRHRSQSTPQRSTRFSAPSEPSAQPLQLHRKRFHRRCYERAGYHRRPARTYLHVRHCYSLLQQRRFRSQGLPLLPFRLHR